MADTRTPTCLVDLVELLGAEVAFGSTTKVVAVQRLVEFADGGLTRFGAADLLDRAATVRASYRHEADEARLGLERVRRALEKQERGDTQ